MGRWVTYGYVALGEIVFVGGDGGCAEGSGAGGGGETEEEGYHDGQHRGEFHDGCG